MDINTQLKLSKTKILLPCVIFLLFATIFFAASILLFIYSFVILAASSSPMIFFILFASCFISFGIGLFLSDFGDRFLQKYLHTYGDKNHPHPLMHDKKEAKTMKEKILTFSNIYTVVLILGVIFTIIGAGLGALDHSNWVTATKEYKEEVGYYEMPHTYTVSFDQGDVDEAFTKLEIQLNYKNAAIIYYNDTDNKNFIYFNGYQNFPGQIVTTKDNGVRTLSDKKPPELKRAKDKMLFFMFKENELAQQIQIYIPNTLKDKVTIIGDHVVAK